MGYTQAPLVMNVPNLTPTQKLILMAITLRANDDHNDCMWASQATIAAECGTTRETVNATIKVLEARGILSRSPRFRPSPSGAKVRTTDYVRVHYDVMGGELSTPGVVNSDHQGGDLMSPLNREGNQEEEKVTAAAQHARAASTASSAGTAAPEKNPRRVRAHLERAQHVVDHTRARSVHGVADIIAWAVSEHELSPEDAAQHLVALGANGQPVSIQALSTRLLTRVTPEAVPVDPEDGARAAARAGRLRALAESRPDLAPGVALLMEASEQRDVKCTPAEAERVQEELRGLTSLPITAQTVAAAARAAADDGELVTPHSVEPRLRRPSTRSAWDAPEVDLSWN